MPVRSLTSSVLRWPSRDEVLTAAGEYARAVVDVSPRVLRVGIFGSYARGNPGPGSDADLLVEVDRSEELFERRALGLPPPRLPVPVDLVVLTRDEISEMTTRRPRWRREVLDATIWLASRPPELP